MGLLHIIDNNELLNKWHIHLACTDTSSWNNGNGIHANTYTCEYYRTHYCEYNSVGSLAGVSMAGVDFNFPEKNCCGCGKGNEIMGILFKP